MSTEFPAPDEGIEWTTFDPTNWPGTPAPGVWVCEVQHNDPDDSNCNSYSVTLFPSRAEAVAWAMRVIDDEREMWDADADDDEQDPALFPPSPPYRWLENHQQPCGESYFPHKRYGAPLYECWLSTWLQRWPVKDLGYDP